MTGHENALGLGTKGASGSWLADTNDTPLGYPFTSASRPRCARCGHPLRSHKSVARNHGPVCWRRVDVGRLDLARADAGRRLAALARQVARADMDELDRIGRALDLVGGELL